MQSGFEWVGFARLDALMLHVELCDPTELMEDWRDIIVEGNRRGVLSGRDGYDQPMPALKYRDGKGKRTGNRQSPHYGLPSEGPQGKGGAGPYAAGFDLNLTTAEYQALTGPRLAPRGVTSRVISHLHTSVNNPAPGRWEVIGAWADVVSAKGVPFLPYHFEGAGRLPRYDLRPVRPADLRFAANAVQAFVRENLFARY